MCVYRVSCVCVYRVCRVCVCVCRWLYKNYVWVITTLYQHLVITAIYFLVDYINSSSDLMCAVLNVPGIVASLVQADWLFLLTDVPALYTADPVSQPYLTYTSGSLITL